MSTETCGACSGTKREWLWRKLGGCVRCMRLSWWGMIATWLALAGAAALAMPLTVTISVGVAALALSLLWLIHWGAFVGKNVAMVSEIVEAGGEVLTRRELLALALQEAIAAIVLVCTTDSGSQAQGKPGCGPITVEVVGHGQGNSESEACRNARADYAMKAAAERLNCTQRCRQNDVFCRGGECACVNVSIGQPRCEIAVHSLAQQQKLFICACRGNVIFWCRCLGACCATLGDVLVIGAEMCDENQQQAVNKARAALERQANLLCERLCATRWCLGGLRCVCSIAQRTGDPNCQVRQIPDPNRPGRTLWCARCAAVYRLHCKCV
jgi:hypothetical protein